MAHTLSCGTPHRLVAQVFSISRPNWQCRIREGMAGMVRAQWTPDARHIITFSDFGLHMTIWSLSTRQVTHSPTECPVIAPFDLFFIYLFFLFFAWSSRRALFLAEFRSRITGLFHLFRHGIKTTLLFLLRHRALVSKTVSFVVFVESCFLKSLLT